MAKRSVLKEVLIEGKKPKPHRKGEVARKAQKELSILRNSPLSWILKPPPQWLSDQFQEELNLTTIYLLANYEVEELLSFFNLRKKQRVEGKAYLRQIPSDVIDKIDGLIRINELIKTRQKSRIRGGETTGRIKKEEAELEHKRIRDLATELLKTKSKREIAGMILQRLPYRKSKIYTALRKHPSDYWK